MQIAIPIFDGFDDLDALGPHEVFTHARNAGANLTVELCTLQARETVTSAHGLRIHPHARLPTPETSESSELPDLVVVPGGGWSDGGGAREQVERGALPAALEALAAHGTTAASVCTGGMILAAAGLTDGRPAVTHHSALTDLEESGAEVVEARVVDDGDLVTAGGITAGIDLALHLVAREFGLERENAVARTMEYERRGDVHTESFADRHNHH